MNPFSLVKRYFVWKSNFERNMWRNHKLGVIALNVGIVVGTAVWCNYQDRKNDAELAAYRQLSKHNVI